MQKPKIAVIGCGHWGKNLVRNFSEIGVLEYVCDSNFIHAKKIAKEYNIKAKSIQDILILLNILN